MAPRRGNVATADRLQSRLPQRDSSGCNWPKVVTHVYKKTKMKCRCKVVQSFGHNEGKEYADAHLDQINVDDKNWMVLYKCPDTDFYWVKSYPDSEQHGGGPARFDRISQDQANDTFST